MPNRKTFDPSERYDHSAHSTQGAETGDLKTTLEDRSADQAVPAHGTVSVPGGFANDPNEPSDPDEAIEKFRRSNLRPAAGRS
jgi:hypothetical protein